MTYPTGVHQAMAEPATQHQMVSTLKIDPSQRLNKRTEESERLRWVLTSLRMTRNEFAEGCVRGERQNHVEGARGVERCGQAATRTRRQGAA